MKRLNVSQRQRRIHQELTQHVLADCSKTLPGCSRTIWTGIEAKPHGSHGMVESRIYSDELSEWRLFDFG